MSKIVFVAVLAASTLLLACAFPDQLMRGGSVTSVHVDPAPATRLTTLVVPINKQAANEASDRRIGRAVAERLKPHLGTLVYPWLLDPERREDFRLVLEGMTASHLGQGRIDPGLLRRGVPWMQPDIVLVTHVTQYDQPVVDTRKVTRIAMDVTAYDARSGTPLTRAPVVTLHRHRGPGSVFDAAEAEVVAAVADAMEPVIAQAAAGMHAWYHAPSPTHTPAVEPPSQVPREETGIAPFQRMLDEAVPTATPTDTPTATATIQPLDEAPAPASIGEGARAVGPNVEEVMLAAQLERREEEIERLRDTVELTVREREALAQALEEAEAARLRAEEKAREALSRAQARQQAREAREQRLAQARAQREEARLQAELAKAERDAEKEREAQEQARQRAEAAERDRLARETQALEREARRQAARQARVEATSAPTPEAAATVMGNTPRDRILRGLSPSEQLVYYQRLEERERRRQAFQAVRDEVAAQ